MPSIGDVVELQDGSVGVISDQLSSPPNVQQWRVHFPEGSRLDILAGFISQTLSAPTYEAGDEVTVWPHNGTVQSVSGDQVTVQLERAVRIEGVGQPQWEPDVTVPFWRIVLDNDGRLKRNWL